MPVLAAFLLPHPPLIMPEVGHGEEKKIISTIDAYKKVAEQVDRINPDTVVIISPHSVMYGDYFHISPGKGSSGSFAGFGAPQLAVKADYDEQFVSALGKICRKADIPAGILGEQDPSLDHGTMIPLRFLQAAGGHFRVVRIGISGLTPVMHYNFGRCIAHTAALLGRKLVVIASGDLSHKLRPEGPYGFSESGPKFDRLTIEALKKGDFLSLLQLDPDFYESAAECGLRPLWITAGALDRRWIKSTVYSYEGPFGVGYGIAGLIPEAKVESRNIGDQLQAWQDEQRIKRMASEDEYVRLARLSLETYIKTGRRSRLPEKVTTELLEKQAGAFVCLKIDGRLRGCIGTVLPATECIAYEIMMNAVSAGTCDSRFPKVTEQELQDIVYSVDVLTEPEEIDSLEKLDVHKYGVIVESGDRRGLLLPDLSGVETPEQQVNIAREKGAISPGDQFKLYRFEVVRHK